MRQNERDKRNYIIGGLLVLVMFMTIGFAAFRTALNINGTASITSNWCVGFDNRNTSAYQITKGVSAGTNPTGEISFSGTACSTNYVPNSTLTANFYQPGDKIEYTLTIANKSSMSAAIESIEVNDSSVTSNQTITDGNIIWKVYMPETTTLSSNATTTMKVSAEFQNATDISNMTQGDSSSLTVGINVVQDDGSNAMDITPAAFSGTIYRNNANLLFNGFPMSGDGTIYYSSNEFSSAQEAFNAFWFYASQEACTEDGNDSCSSGTVTFNPGAYETTASNLNKPYYLKHVINNNIVESTYVCFVTDTEHCMQAGNSSYYNTNKTLLQGLESWFTGQSGSCDFGDGYSNCVSSALLASAYSDGGVYAGVLDDGFCEVNYSGRSDCEVIASGG